MTSGRRGSALLMALWIIAILAVMVFSFAFEAHQQAGINVYVRERNRVNRLVEPGRIIGEIVMTGFSDAKEWSKDEDEKELDEEDRWYKEKRALKFENCCKIGPILMDEDDPDSGTVTLALSNGEGQAADTTYTLLDDLTDLTSDDLAKVTLETSAMTAKLKAKLKLVDGNLVGFLSRIGFTIIIK